MAETYAIAWRRLRDIPAGGAALPWLFGVCRRVLANQRRAHDRRERLVQRVRSTARAATDGNGETTGVALDVLARLGPDDQELLKLVAWEGLSHEEIAIALGISRNAVAIRLHRARLRFKAALQTDQGAGPRPLRRWRSSGAMKEARSSRTPGDVKAALGDRSGIEKRS